MTKISSLKSRSSPSGLPRKLGASALTLALFASQVGTAHADIDNTATANGSPATGGGSVASSPDTVNVPVVPADPKLTVAKTAAAPVDVNADGIIKSGDTITYTYLVQNTGNVTIENVVPVDTGPTFNNIPYTGSLGPFSPSSVDLAPGASQSFTAVYTLSDLDAFRAAGITAAGGDAVENSATATGTPPPGATLATVTPSLAESEIPANPALSIDKTYVITTDNGTPGRADLGDIITYTYTVVNTGNVAINNLTINDVHEGVALSGEPSAEAMAPLMDGPLAPGTPSTDSLPNNAVWTTIQPGATVTFTYVHPVTQAEVDGG